MPTKECPCCEGKGVVTEPAWFASTKRLKLGHIQRTALLVLMKNYPLPISLEKIIQTCYGNKEPDWAHGSLRVCMYRLKQLIRPIGGKIYPAGKQHYRVE